MNPTRVAVMIPCRNEETTIATVVREFTEALPGASIYVFDNDSSDASVERATAAGAIVRTVVQPGKGNVVRRMFSDVDADCYVLVDGDGTYDASVAPQVVHHIMSGDDLVNVARVPIDPDAYRAGHLLGNRVLGGTLTRLFGRNLDDALSGYKGCSRRLVKSFPALYSGFEIETELVVHALQLNVSMREIKGDYRARPAGSASKLSTWGDGSKILRAIIGLVRRDRPMVFFSGLAALLSVLGIALGVPVVTEFVLTRKVPRFPTAILATGLELLAAQSLAVGLEVDTSSRARREQRILAFLALSGPRCISEGTDETRARAIQGEA